MTVFPSAARAVPLPDADSAVAALLAVHELRYPGEAHHAERVAELAFELTTQLRPKLAATDGIGHAYLLHDVGKLGIPDEILLKPDVLTPVELRVVQTHTTLGEELVRRLRFLSPLVRDVVASHHERWDGSGYPRRLAGSQIPLAARILSVVDAFDAMIHDRPYRDALPLSWALAELRRCSGTQFDPVVVDAFLQLRDAWGGWPPARPSPEVVLA
jgi:HD-GYP domain-containing protein (c-di-GMP phosphodiesterase class II)